MKRKSSKHKRSGRKILILLLVLAILGVLIYIAPDPKPVGTADLSEWPEGIELPAPVPGEQIVNHTGYTLSYNEEWEQPSWVAYQLTRDKVNGALKRQDDFRADPAIMTESATLDDYRSSGYDRGHLCPAADQKWSKKAMSESFYLSNMSPQEPSFNRGIWADLEAVTRTQANNLGSVYVTTGPILDGKPKKTIGDNKVGVPRYYYKTILYYDGENARAIGFILPNKKGTKDLSRYAVTIDEVEKRSNLDLYPALDDSIEEDAESTFSVDVWQWEQFRPGDEATTVVESGSDTRQTLINLALVVAQDLREYAEDWIESL